MSIKSWDALESTGVTVRYRLSENIKTLLKARDLYNADSIKKANLPLLVRLSSRNRRAIIDTIAYCADKIRKEPKEVGTCVDIIEMCTDILEIAERFPVGFHFMQLSQEIREKIMGFMLNILYRSKTVMPKIKKSTCSCLRCDRGITYSTPHVKALPALLGPSLRDEFSRVFFRDMAFRFDCTCELLVHITQNVHLRENVREISVHWRGKDAVQGFNALASCRKLEVLDIGISKLSFTHLSDHATEMQKYFPLTYRSPRFSDVLGFHELLNIRGLRGIVVTHALLTNGSRAVEAERQNLEILLDSKLTDAADDLMS